MNGDIRLRLSSTEDIRALRTTTPVGEFVVRTSSAGKREVVGGTLKKHSSSTPFYKALAQLVAQLGQSGTVLVVRYSRHDTQLFADALASHLSRREDLGELTNLVKARLGMDHPLTRVLPFGIVFHHAGLPGDILAEIEDAIRNGTVQYVVAT